MRLGDAFIINSDGSISVRVGITINTPNGSVALPVGMSFVPGAVSFFGIDHTWLNAHWNDPIN